MNKIFEKMSPENREHAVNCLGMRRRKLATGEVLFREGEASTSFGIVMSGAVNVLRYTLSGHARVLTQLAAGEAFGTSFALSGASRYFANIEATEPTEVILLSAKRLLSPCPTRCAFHTNLIVRLLETLARRNTALARKIDCLTQHTLREKLLAYLEMQAETAGGDKFVIPFNRQQLADYLNVDRCALSTEIGKLTREGVLKANRSAFTLCRQS